MAKVRMTSSRLEQLPRELRNSIYSHLGLEAGVQHNAFDAGVKCRHAFICGGAEHKTRVLHCRYFEANKSSDDAPGADLTSLLALSGSASLLHTEIEDLLYNHAVLVVELNKTV